MRYFWLILILQAGCGVTPGPVSESGGQNVVLITFDGLRQEELFSGIDQSLLDPEHEELRKLYGGESPEQRRSLLMRFFWETLAPQGVVLGNRSLGSEGRVANPHRFSYPGYAELLTGRVLAGVDSNDPVRIPVETVLEFARRQLELPPDKVACIASWATFDAICAQRPDTIFLNAGVRRLPVALRHGNLELLDLLQQQILPPWDQVRSDPVTFQIALEYLKIRRPRLLYLALDDTDDWAHQERYDRVIQTIRVYDDYLRQLWELLQSMPAYRGRTTLLLTSDHGRGSGEDWTRHGEDVPGAEFIWLAAVGPGTPGKGELGAPSSFYQKEIAATVLRLLDLNPDDYHPGIGAPIQAALEKY